MDTGCVLRMAPDVQLGKLDAESIEIFLYGGDDEPTMTHHPSMELDLGKTWSAIDALLAPIELLGHGGREVGPAQTFTAAQVTQLSAQLTALDQRALLGRFEAEKLEGSFDGLYEKIRELQMFLRAAVTK